MSSPLERAVSHRDYLSNDAKLDLPSKISWGRQQGRQQQRGVLIEICPQCQECGPNDLNPDHCHHHHQSKGGTALLVFLPIVESNGLCTITQESLSDVLLCNFLRAVSNSLTILAELRHILPRVCLHFRM